MTAIVTTVEGSHPVPPCLHRPFHHKCLSTQLQLCLSRAEWRLANGFYRLKNIHGSFSCLTLGPGSVVIASDGLLTYQNLRAGGNVEKGNELLVRTDAGICPIASAYRCAGGWMGAGVGSGPFGVVILRRGRVLWLVYGRLGVLFHTPAGPRARPTNGGPESTAHPFSLHP